MGVGVGGLDEFVLKLLVGIFLLLEFVLLLVLNYFVSSIPFNLYNGCSNEYACCEQTKLSFHQ